MLEGYDMITVGCGVDIWWAPSEKAEGTESCAMY